MEKVKEVLQFLKDSKVFYVSTVDGKFEVVYLNHAKATVCSFTEAPVVIEF